MATLKLKPDAVVEAEQITPTLDRSQNYAEVGGEHGVKYLQGNAYFNPRGDFVRYCEAGVELKPESAEGALMRKQKEARDNKRWGRVPQRAGAAALPHKVVQAAKENAQALAAEAQAG